MIRQYGVLAYRFEPDGSHRVLLITSRETKRWVIPRGNLMSGLAAHVTAAQEAYEEAGLIGNVAPEAIGFYDYDKRRKNARDVQAGVQVFPMEVTEQKADWPEKDERERRWFDPDAAARRVDEHGLRDLIREFRPIPGKAGLESNPSLWPRSSKTGWSMLKIFKAVMPKEDKFFDMFARHADTLVAGADVMSRMFSTEESIEESCRKITDYEHQADDITREVLLAVRRTFITPFDRSAITDLVTSMDDAIDEMRQTAKAITLYDVTAFEPEMAEMSKLACKAARLVAEAVPLLKSVGRNGARLDRITEKIVHLEGEADDLHEMGLKKLFQEHGEARPMAFFVGRQIYIHLERVLDGFEDVANEIQGIVIDHA